MASMGMIHLGVTLWRRASAPPLGVDAPSGQMWPVAAPA